MRNLSGVTLSFESISDALPRLLGIQDYHRRRKSAGRRAHQDQVIVGGRGQLLLDSVSSDVAFAALPEPAGGLIDDVVHLHRIALSRAARADA